MSLTLFYLVYIQIQIDIYIIYILLKLLFIVKCLFFTRIIKSRSFILTIYKFHV